MAPSDIRRISVQRRGSIFVFCVVRKTGEADILGFALGVGRHGVRGVHGAMGVLYRSKYSVDRELVVKSRVGSI